MNNFNFNVYVIDPHLDPFFSNPISRLGDNFNAKYRFIIEENNWSKYINKSSLYLISSERQSLNAINKWKKLNNINPNILFKDLNKIKIDKSDLIFISSSILINLWKFNKTKLQEIAKKSNLIIAINHYLWMAPKLTSIFNSLSNSHLLCERSPKVYSKYLNDEEIDALNNHLFIELPYMPNISLKKCRSIKKFPKCAIIGQTHKLFQDHIFTKKTGYPFFHKLRNNLRKKYLSNQINKKLFIYYGPKIKIEFNIIFDNFINHNILKLLLKKLKIYIRLKNKIKQLQKIEITKYYRETKPFKDIFKEYSIILCGEEDILQLPVLGVFEAMMAGCIPLASLEEYYESIGMKKNVHYIKFDGSYEDAERKVLKLKSNPLLINKIINNIHKFSDKNLTATNSVDIIIEKIKESMI